MSKIITTEVFTYDELNEEAKEKALQWALESSYVFDWWDCTYDHAKTIGLEITSFGLDRHRHAKGEFITSAPECAETILTEHGATCETYKTAKAYLDELAATGDRPSDTTEDADDSDWEEKREEIGNEFLRALLEDYSIILQNESDYMGSREYLENMIEANEYTFTVDGKRFG